LAVVSALEETLHSETQKKMEAKSRRQKLEEQNPGPLKGIIGMILRATNARMQKILTK
jgi:hypothetical protein